MTSCTRKKSGVARIISVPPGENQPGRSQYHPKNLALRKKIGCRWRSGPERDGAGRVEAGREGGWQRGGAAWLEVGGCWGVGTDGGSLGWGGRSTNFFRKYEISPSI